jgi:hypothetical protein
MSGAAVVGLLVAVAARGGGTADEDAATATVGGASDVVVGECRVVDLPGVQLVPVNLRIALTAGGSDVACVAADR